MKKLLVALATAALLVPAAAMAESEFSIVLQGGAAKYNQSMSGSDTGAAYGARLACCPRQCWASSSGTSARRTTSTKA